MPVSGAQQAWLQEMLHAAVHSTYRRPGSAPASSERAGGASSFFSGSFKGQSPQNFDPPATMSRRSEEATSPVHTPVTLVVRASPRMRRPYGSAQPHVSRPSQSSTIVVHGHEQVKRVER